MTKRWTGMLEGTAVAVALGGSAGSIFLSLGMGLVACPLCFYERTFLLGALGVLLASFLVRDRIASGTASFLAIPLATGGLGAALFHVGLELNGTLECPDGILGLGSAPQQSLAAFLLLTTAVVLAGWASGGQRSPLKTLAALGLGLLLTVACVASAPPLPQPKARPSKAEGYILKGCEPAPTKAP